MVAQKQALLREFVAAVVASHNAAEARRALPAGSSRAKVTTANSRWTAQSENRDRLAAQLPAELALQLQSWLTSPGE